MPALRPPLARTQTAASSIPMTCAMVVVVMDRCVAALASAPPISKAAKISRRHGGERQAFNQGPLGGLSSCFPATPAPVPLSPNRPKTPIFGDVGRGVEGAADKDRPMGSR
jgi:hypothetical protein